MCQNFCDKLVPCRNILDLGTLALPDWICTNISGISWLKIWLDPFCSGRGRLSCVKKMERFFASRRNLAALSHTYRTPGALFIILSKSWHSLSYARESWDVVFGACGGRRYHHHLHPHTNQHGQEASHQQQVPNRLSLLTDGAAKLRTTAPRSCKPLPPPPPLPLFPPLRPYTSVIQTHAHPVTPPPLRLRLCMK